MPEQVPQAVIEAFEREGHPVPDLNIKLDWNASLCNSQWNKMAIGFIAETFLENVQRGDYHAVKYDQKTITISLIIQFVQIKLALVSTRAYRERVASETIDEALLAHIQQMPIRDLTRKRRYGRRKGVCLIFTIRFPQR